MVAWGDSWELVGVPSSLVVAGQVGSLGEPCETPRLLWDDSQVDSHIGPDLMFSVDHCDSLLLDQDQEGGCGWEFLYWGCGSYAF